MPGTPSDDVPDEERATAPHNRPTVRLSLGSTSEHETVRLPSQRPTVPVPGPTTGAGGTRARGAGAGGPAAGGPAVGGTAAGGARRGPGRRAPLLLAASVTTIWASVVSFVPLLLVVLLAGMMDSPGGPASRVVRLALAGWLLAHGVPLHTGLGPIGLAPLGLTAFAGWRLFRAGVHTGRAVGVRRTRNGWPALRVGLAVGAVYGVLGALAAVVVSVPGLAVSVPRAAGTLAVAGCLAATAGAAADARILVRWLRRLPLAARDGLRGGAIAALLILGAGAAVAGMAVALAGGEASQILADYHTGVAGQAGLTLVCVLYAPTVATWSASYLVGPGFVVGTQTAISAGHVVLGPLPAVPILAGLPSGPSSIAASLLLVVPLAAGMAAGWLLARRRIREAAASTGADVVSYRWTSVLAAAAITGPVGGLLLGVACVVASGSLGAGRLAQVGPRTTSVVLVAAAVVTVGAVAAAAARLVIGVQRRHPV